MVLRWVAAGVLEAAKGFRRVQGCQDMPALVAALRARDGCFRHQLLLPSPYLVLTKPLRLDIQCQRPASVKIGWKYLDD